MNTRQVLVMVALVGGVVAAGLEQRRPVSADLPPGCFSRAFASYNAGNYDNVLELAQHAVLQQPVAAWGILGATHCKRLDLRDAKTAYEKLKLLNPDEANFVRRTCETRGLALDRTI